MTNEQANIWLIILILLLIFGLGYAISNSEPTPLTKRQEQELIKDHWDSLTPEERQKLK